MARIPIKVADGPVESVKRVFVDGLPVNITTTLGSEVMVSANADQWRPQDFAPIARAIVFGSRS